MRYQGGPDTRECNECQYDKYLQLRWTIDNMILNNQNLI